jgi:hypothetical protein
MANTTVRRPNPVADNARARHRQPSLRDELAEQILSEDARRVHAEVEVVTPEMAAEWLGRNRHNRNMKRTVIDKVTGAISRGEWMINGEAPKFDWDGNLLDGQNRLAAVVESGRPIETLVVYGLDPTSQQTMDTGAKRSAADVLALRGEPNPFLLAATVPWVWRWYAGLSMHNHSPYPTPQQLVAALERHPEVRDHLQPAVKLHKKIRLTPSVGAFSHFLLHTEADAELAEGFFEGLNSGANLAGDSPILLLRRAVERDAFAVRRMEPRRVLALVFKAWNYYLEDRPIRLLFWKATEAFPIPGGTEETRGSEADLL